MTEAGQATQEAFCQSLDADDRKIRDDLVRHHGHQLTRLAPSQTERWNSRLAQVIDAWIEDMQGVGQDARGVLKAYHDTGRQDI
jgi:hypothetical protein